MGWDRIGWNKINGITLLCFALLKSSFVGGGSGYLSLVDRLFIS